MKTKTASIGQTLTLVPESLAAAIVNSGVPFSNRIGTTYRVGRFATECEIPSAPTEPDADDIRSAKPRPKQLQEVLAAAADFYFTEQGELHDVPLPINDPDGMDAICKRWQELTPVRAAAAAKAVAEDNGSHGGGGSFHAPPGSEGEPGAPDGFDADTRMDQLALIRWDTESPNCLD